MAEYTVVSGETLNQQLKSVTNLFERYKETKENALKCYTIIMLNSYCKCKAYLIANEQESAVWVDTAWQDLRDALCRDLDMLAIAAEMNTLADILTKKSISDKEVERVDRLRKSDIFANLLAFFEVPEELIEALATVE